MIDKQVFQFPIIYTNPIGRIAFGWGAHQTVADECKALKMKKPLITTTGLEGTGIVDEIKQVLKTGGVAAEIYDQVTSNPKDFQIMEAYKVFKESGCDGVISIGGGSSHDCGKGVRIVHANGGKHITEFAAFISPPWMEELKKFKSVTIPQIAINTTAGTGAESTPFCTFTNTRVRAKQISLIPGSTPTLAIIDPLIIRLMPENIAAWTGFDALAHGFEAFLSKLMVHHSAAMEMRVLKIVSENLREFAHNRMNHKACEMMCWAASMGGVAIGLGAGAGIVHGLAHQIGALTDCHHGLSNAAVTLTLERYNEPACPEKFAEMAGAMGVDTRGLTVIQAADRWFDEIERLLKDLDIKSGHLNEQFGLQRKDLEHIVNVYSNDWCSEGNARAFNREEVMKLLESMF